MRRDWIARATSMSMLVLVMSCSGEREAEIPGNLMKVVGSTLASKGMAVGEFSEVSDYPLSTQGREHVRCASVSRNDGECRVCLVSYTDANTALAGVRSKFRSKLPDGSSYFARGRTVFVVEPGPRQSNSLVQDVHDELIKLQ